MDLTRTSNHSGGAVQAVRMNPLSTSWKLPLMVFLFTGGLLAVVQLRVENPMLLLERFFPGWGWAEIVLIGLYGAIVAYYMQQPRHVQTWRKYTWIAFSVVFFTQLILGLSGFERFLMTGNLHLPVPMMILGGPVYRGEISVMTILFLSTVLLSGPAWCSHICYFGAMDNLASAGKTRRTTLRNKWTLKWTVLLMVVAAALILRWLQVPALSATLLAGGFGVIGIGLILALSRREGKMVHCTAYCPIGTVVSYARLINPFRMKIDERTCTDCMRCTPSCKYDALNVTDIRARKPGRTCTLCGDCVSSCHAGSIQYRLGGLKPAAARNLYLFITISLHAATMALARI